MDNQKIDNQLNLALDSTMQDREKSLDLNVGYDSVTNVWELIVRYNGSLERLQNLNIKIIPLINNYAILRVPQELIQAIAEYDEIIYIEKPKRLNFTIRQGIRSSCISPLQSDEFAGGGLFGEGVIVAIIDSGIDYRHPAFINENGTTKILEIWDQSVGDGSNVDNYQIGTIFTERHITEALQNNVSLTPATIDVSGHGTAVASIASGVASGAKLLIVKLGQPLPNTFPRTSELMMAIDYCVKKGEEMNLPIAINLSFGNNYGAHNGTSLLETFIDIAAQTGKTTIVAGTGNEAASAIHTEIELGNNPMNVDIRIGQYEPSVNIQLWKNYVDDFDINIVAPSGESTGIISRDLGTNRYTLGNTYVLIYYGEPSPYSQSQEIYFDFIPKNTYIDEGIWRVEIIPKRIVDGKVNMWLPTASTLNSTAFFKPTPNVTLTIPSTSKNVISVGAYNSFNDSYADFSGRGYDGDIIDNKPDIVAPGVNIMCASPGGGYVIRSGTSMAAPFVTGSVALLNEWGIVKENDRFLYGEKVKAYLKSGARQLPGENVTPNPRTGFGALCVADSIK